eukprot:Rmarinus@m.21521
MSNRQRDTRRRSRDRDYRDDRRGWPEPQSSESSRRNREEATRPPPPSLPGRAVERKMYHPVHFCPRCEHPILKYARLLPCYHLFCRECADLTVDKCFICGSVPEQGQTRVSYQDELENAFVCPFSQCRRGYWKLNSLEGHINVRHAAREGPGGVAPPGLASKALPLPGEVDLGPPELPFMGDDRHLPPHLAGGGRAMAGPGGMMRGPPGVGQGVQGGNLPPATRGLPPPMGGLPLPSGPRPHGPPPPSGHPRPHSPPPRSQALPRHLSHQSGPGGAPAAAGGAGGQFGKGGSSLRGSDRGMDFPLSHPQGHLPPQGGGGGGRGLGGPVGPVGGRPGHGHDHERDGDVGPYPAPMMPRPGMPPFGPDGGIRGLMSSHPPSGPYHGGGDPMDMRRGGSDSG